ncbi:hypothetical protein V8C35DRAFT_310065 [Trichoderma chlorosporum]
MSIPLKHYLQAAYKEFFANSEVQTDAFQQLTTELHRENDNILLVYSGAFNPPHPGHVEALLSGLKLETLRLTTVGIVIVPCTDEYVKSKLIDGQPYVFLSEARRADIWDAIPSIPKTTVWVWRGAAEQFKPFTQTLIRSVEADGLTLSIALFCGPDNINLQSPFSKDLFYDFDHIVVTNKARHLSTHFHSNGTPVRWGDSEEWTLHADDDKKVQNNEQESVEAMLWMCTTNQYSQLRKGYYLQYLSPAAKDTSSTSLRQALSQYSSERKDYLNELETRDLLKLLTLTNKNDEQLN